MACLYAGRRRDNRTRVIAKGNLRKSLFVFFCLLSTEARWLIVSLVPGFCTNTPSIPNTAAALPFPPAVQGTGQSARL